MSKNVTYAMKDFIGKVVTIKVRLYGRCLKGVFKSFDKYSNVSLENVEEYMLNDQGVYEVDAQYPHALVRGDSIVNISVIEEQSEIVEA